MVTCLALPAIPGGLFEAWGRPHPYFRAVLRLHLTFGEIILKQSLRRGILDPMLGFLVLSRAEIVVCVVYMECALVLKVVRGYHGLGIPGSLLRLALLGQVATVDTRPLQFLIS